MTLSTRPTAFGRVLRTGRPHSLVEWLTAIALVVFWPLALLAFFVALMRSED